MKLIVGLGNPGRKFELTRHNLGFLAIDEISKRFNIKINYEFENSIIGFKNIFNSEIILMKPLTYMNLSGTVVKSAIRKWKIDNKDLIVIYDDIALKIGTIRIREKGSSAGHKGVQSIIDNLNTDNFLRIRIGIGPVLPGVRYEDFVLSNFTKSEFNIIKNVINKIPEIVETILTISVQEAMNKFNRKEII
jgi:PTH1 family peptidyl-tRNA hydrolase